MSELYSSKASIEDSIMQICKMWAELRSKDPNTKVGAAVYDPISGGVFLGYNGFPKGFPDRKLYWDNRDSSAPNNKYKFVKHAEPNAIEKAVAALGLDLSRCILFITNHPCHVCMKNDIAPRGIKKVYFASPYPEDKEADLMAQELGIELILLPIRN